MSWTPLQVVVIASFMVLAGCVAAAPSTTDTGATTTSLAIETEATTPSTESGVTAHFILNNRGEEPYNATIYGVQDPNESTDYFPLEVTLRNGSTRIYRDIGDVQTLSEILAVAADIEPANGTLVTVHQTVPPQSSLLVDVENAPEDAKPLVVISETGTTDPPIQGFSLSSKICTGSNAKINTFNESVSASASCGNVSDVAFPDPISRHSTTVNTTSL